MSNNEISILLNRLAGVYRDPARIIRDSSALLRNQLGQNLRPTISALSLDDGTYHPSVLVFQGTIAMTYRSKQYNIPIDVYIPPQYPIRPPTVFVRPVANMVIKHNHRNVGSDGMVYMPYFHSWNQNNHNLVEMASSMSLLFGADPPVFSRKSNTTTSQQHPPTYTDVDMKQQAAAHAEIQRKQRLKEEEDARIALELSLKEERERVEKQKMEERRRLEEEKHRLQEDRAVADSLRDEVTRKLQSHLHVFFEESRERMTNDLKDQTALSGTEKTISNQVQHLSKCKEDLTKYCTEVDEKTEILRGIVRSSNQATSKEEVNVDDLVQAADLHSEQMLALAAENAAITDCLYFLDKALAKGTIPLEVHLRKVRQLAKRQFLIRAHCMKIGHLKSSVALLNASAGTLGASMLSL